MNSFVRRLVPVLSLGLAMVAGCSDSTGSNHPQITGTVSEIRSNSNAPGGVLLLILDATSGCDCGIGPRVWVGVSPTTAVRVLRRAGELADIRVGSYVRATLEGTIADSDPQLAGAARVDVLPSV